MSEETQAPPQSVPPSKRGWWVAWVLAAGVLPALLGILAAKTIDGDLLGVWVLGFLSIGFHGVACWKLRDASGCMFLFLLLGGWALMAGTFFAGCLSNVSFH
jgi:hypothetical protein